MLSNQFNQIFSVAEFGIMNCSGCGKPMKLACVEPDKPGFDLRAFECAYNLPRCHLSRLHAPFDCAA
jgi:hypothetical protein